MSIRLEGGVQVVVGASAGLAGAGGGIVTGVNGSLYQVGVACACWCSYHPTSPFFVTGVSMAALMIIFGGVMYGRPAWGKWAALGLWGASLASIPLGDQFWLGAFIAALSALAWYRGSVKPPQVPKISVYLAMIGIPLAVVLVIVAYVLVRGGRVLG